MAPPVNRRSGFSRRAQYSTFLSYTAGALGAVVGLALVIISIVNPGAFSSLRGAAADVTGPAAKATAGSRAVSKDVLSSIGGFFQMGSKHARLERELAEAKVRLIEADAIKAENRRLKQLLDLKEKDEGAVAVARLISSTSGSARRFATLDAGRNKGLATGMPIRSNLGLVGRVLEVGGSTSRVLLVTDTESLVPVRRSTDGVPAFAQGNGDGTLRIRLINLGINPLKKGDIMVTSGSGGLYRPGTPIAILTDIVRDGAVARVLSNPSDTDYVVVEKAWMQQQPPPPPPASDEKSGE